MAAFRAVVRDGLSLTANPDGSLQAGPALRLMGERAWLSPAAQDLSGIEHVQSGRAVLGRLDESGMCVLIRSPGAMVGPPNLLVLALPPRECWRAARRGWAVLYEPALWPNALDPVPGELVLFRALARLAYAPDLPWDASCAAASAAATAFRAERRLAPGEE